MGIRKGSLEGMTRFTCSVLGTEGKFQAGQQQIGKPKVGRSQGCSTNQRRLEGGQQPSDGLGIGAYKSLSSFFFLSFMTPPFLWGGGQVGFKEVFSPRSPADLEKDIGLGPLAQPRQKSPGSKF